MASPVAAPRRSRRLRIVVRLQQPGPRTASVVRWVRSSDHSTFSLGISLGVGQSHQKALSAVTTCDDAGASPIKAITKGVGSHHHRRRSTGFSVPNVKYRGYLALARGCKVKPVDR